MEIKRNIIDVLKVWKNSHVVSHWCCKVHVKWVSHGH